MNARGMPLLWLGPLVLLSACTQVDTYGDGVLVDRSWRLPFFSNTAPANGAVYIKTTGFGLITGPTGLSLGYVNQVFAAVPKGECVAVFFIDDPAIAEKITHYLKSQKVSLDKICIIRPQG